MLAAAAALLLALPAVSAQSRFAKKLPPELHLPEENITEADRQKIIKHLSGSQEISLSAESVRLGSNDAARQAAMLSKFDTRSLIEALYQNEQSGLYMRAWDDLGPTSVTPAIQKYFAYGIRNARNKDEFLRYLIQYGERASYDDERIIGEYCINKEWDSLSDEQLYQASVYAINGIFNGSYHKDMTTDLRLVYHYSKISLELAGKIYGTDHSQYKEILQLCASIARLEPISDWDMVESMYQYYKILGEPYCNGEIDDIFNDPLLDLYHRYVDAHDLVKAKDVLDIITAPAESRLSDENIQYLESKEYGEAGVYLTYAKAQFDYWAGGTDYPELMKKAYDLSMRCLAPKRNYYNIKDYIVPTYRLAPAITKFMKVSYDSPNTADVYDAALFLKGASDSFSAKLLETAVKSSDIELCEYIDSLRNNFDKEPEWWTQNPFENLPEAEFQAWSARETKFETKINTVLGIETAEQIWKDNIIHWSEVRDALEEDEAAIEFVNSIPLPGGDIEYKALIINHGDSIPTAVRLCNDEELKTTLSKRHLYDSNAGEIYGIVWEPILPHIKGHKLHLSPIGLLGAVNLAAIPDSTGCSMGEKFDIHFCTSTGWIAERESDGVHSDGNSEKWNRIELWGGLQSLPESGAEIQEIGNLASAAGVEAAIHSGEECTEESFRAISWKKTGIIHIAAHGFRSSRPQTGDYDEDKDNPLDRCGLILQDGAKNPLDGNGSGKRSSEMSFEERKRESGKSNAIDGVLLGSEIARMNLLGTDLVVLSACGSGKGDYTDEGVYSIARAFRKAGAKTVVATLGRIPDGAARLFMTEFYRHLFAGESKTAAFQAATAALKSTPRYAKPSVWTQFVMYD